MIKAIAFDFGRVLFSSWEGFKEASPQLRGEAIDLSPVYSSVAWRLLLRGKIREDVFWAYFIKEFRVNVGIEELKGAVVKAMMPDRGMLSLVGKLRARYKVYVLSDHCREWISALEKEFGFKKLFDGTFFSFDYGVKKPEPEFFRIFLERTGLAAAECLFVDDQLRNVDAAKSIGMRAVRFVDRDSLMSYLRRTGLLR